MKFGTKDSGVRQEYETGMRRDTQEGKPDFSLCIPEQVPYKEQCLTRWAELMARGADKYGKRNWELARTDEELQRFRASAFRHFLQWYTGEVDEDHLAATWFNMQAVEYVKFHKENSLGQSLEESWANRTDEQIQNWINELECEHDLVSWTEEEHREARWNLLLGYNEPEYELGEEAWIDFGCQEAEIVNYHPDYKWVWE